MCSLSLSLFLSHTHADAYWILQKFSEDSWNFIWSHLPLGFHLSKQGICKILQKIKNSENRSLNYIFTNANFFSLFFFLRSDPEVKVLLLEDTSHISPHMHTLKDDSLRLSYASTFTALTSSRNKNIWLYFLNIFLKYTNLSLKKKTQRSPNCTIISSVKKANKSLSQNSLYFLWKNYHF